MFFNSEIGIELSFFGPWHLLQIFITGLVIFLIIRYKDQIRVSKHEKLMRYCVGSILLAIQLSYYIWKASVGTLTFVNTLPLGVCTINMFVSVYIISTSMDCYFYLMTFLE